MNTPRYTRMAIVLATTFTLAACAVPHTPDKTEVETTYPATAQAEAAASNPYYYRGTENGVAAVSNDAAINANVITALSRLPRQSSTNLQVSTLNGVVTLRGVTDTTAIAQDNVQAARQVPGVQRVDYDIQVHRR
ncbi:BON domain-containing protein [Alcaligenaceae bacterium CGII-47]|nr:BON domain-containing protein [Alcaligenaceae bacterium CGII-47]